MTYIQIPISVDARQMKEDGSNAKDLAAWIDSRDGWIAIHVEDHQSNGRRRREDIVIIFDPYDAQTTLSPGGWVVDIDGGFKIYDDYHFKKRFVKATGKEMNFKCTTQIVM